MNHWALPDDVQVPHQILLAMEGKIFMELKSKCSQKVFQSTLNCHWNHQSWFHTHYEQVSFLAQQHHWFQGKRSRSKDSWILRRDHEMFRMHQGSHEGDFLQGYCFISTPHIVIFNLQRIKTRQYN